MASSRSLALLILAALGAGCGQSGGFAGADFLFGTFVFAPSSATGTVVSYKLGESGSLGAADPITSGTQSIAVAADPRGRFAYVANRGADSITAFAVDRDTGNLSQL